jgi:hypothetical protein
MALYPTSSRRDWAVFYTISTMLALNVAHAIWIPFDLRGTGTPNSVYHCIYTQAPHPRALLSFLVAICAFDGE